ncbi:predicted protein [Pyrenophora tritici-repentis Pt-1C-BFP]|uniref:Uncharacterized protein n=1 Tax=Pyrenophora tritici-repentis (strain Pt-1C-BFP) TaxID=426418 RepID=B2WG96_PYRTR|nr:uncharacterized protein PTRG_08952 [Pyrenophora tritici-repentis Pt-1C-BFP]EDU42003.1 predicted protein [Pyrenophora tritici-repentis Pt-1C-BFP]
MTTRYRWSASAWMLHPMVMYDKTDDAKTLPQAVNCKACCQQSNINRRRRTSTALRNASTAM